MSDSHLTDVEEYEALNASVVDEELTSKKRVVSDAELPPTKRHQTTLNEYHNGRLIETKYKMEGVRWGDLPIIPDSESGITAIEREQITKPRSMELEGPQLHQPSYSESPSTLEISSECLFPDKLVIKTVKLVQHAKKLKAAVQSFQLQQETILVYPPLPAMPIGIDDASPSVVKESKPDDISQIDQLNSIVLDNDCALLVLRKAVAIICAHVGFDVTMENVHSILTDIAQEFFVKLCLQLRQGTDNPNPGFPDVFEQAFHEMGLEPVKSIQTFLQTRIVDYYNNVLNQCKHLMNEYEKLKQLNQQNIDTKPYLCE